MILDILYPPRCIYCYDILGVGGSKFICEFCTEEIEFISGDVCKRCGQPIESEEKACSGCQNKKYYFDRNHALFVYKGNIREAIHRFKYRNKRKYAEYFGKIASQQFADVLSLGDIITEVPMHRKKIKTRGYNQSELFAQEIAKNSDIIHVKNLLQRIKNTKAQSKILSYTARENNIKDAFRLSGNCDIREKTIILADDIFTTGSTLNECTKVLLENGAKKIMSISLSIAVKEPDDSQQ